MSDICYAPHPNIPKHRCCLPAFHPGHHTWTGDDGEALSWKKERSTLDRELDRFNGGKSRKPRTRRHTMRRR